MPANTPVLSTLAPVSLAIIIDCFGPLKPGKTPSISRPNSSGSLPVKTVRATPFIPERKSSRGKSAVAVAGALVVMVAARCCAVATAAENKIATIVRPKNGNFCIKNRIFPFIAGRSFLAATGRFQQPI